MSETRTEKEIIAEAYSDEAAKNWRAPVQGYPNGIPWALHLEAYQATPADQLMGAEPVAWTMKDSYGCDYITMSKHQAALWPKKTPLYAAQPAPADQVVGSEPQPLHWFRPKETHETVILEKAVTKFGTYEAWGGGGCYFDGIALHGGRDERSMVAAKVIAEQHYAVLSATEGSGE